MTKDFFEKLFSLEGKTALINGGYRGIGLAVAETYGEAGANVALVARNLEGCRAAADRIQDKFGVFVDTGSLIPLRRQSIGKIR